jgi:hypothetical protein
MINTNSEIQTVSLSSNSATVILLRKTKPMPSRLDYRIFNFCATCNLKFTKEVLRCPDCKQVRVKPWHRSKITEHKRKQRPHIMWVTNKYSLTGEVTTISMRAPALVYMQAYESLYTRVTFWHLMY